MHFSKSYCKHSWFEELLGILLQSDIINNHCWLRDDGLILQIGGSQTEFGIWKSQHKNMLGHFSHFNFIYCFSQWKLIRDSLYRVLHLHRETRKGKKPTKKRSNFLKERKVSKEGEALTLYPITSDSLARGLTGSHPRDTCEPSCIHIILPGAWLGAEKEK